MKYKYKKLPERNYYPVSECAKILKCTEEDVWHYIETSKLRATVLSLGWWLEYFLPIKVDGHDVQFMSEDVRYSERELLHLTSFAGYTISRDNQIVDPRFKWYAEKEEKAYCCRSKRKRHAEQKPIIIKKSDVVISKHDLDIFYESLPDKTADEYTTPYLELMQAAIKANKIDYKNQPKADTLREWFLNNWGDFEDAADNKVKLMATFVRLPESARGGLKKISKKS